MNHNLQATYRQPTGNLQATYRQPTGNLQATYILLCALVGHGHLMKFYYVPLWDMDTTYKQPTGNLQATYKQPTEPLNQTLDSRISSNTLAGSLILGLVHCPDTPGSIASLLPI